jgi:hypothetical protein
MGYGYGVVARAGETQHVGGPTSGPVRRLPVGVRTYLKKQALNDGAVPHHLAFSMYWHLAPLTRQDQGAPRKKQTKKKSDVSK